MQFSWVALGKCKVTKLLRRSNGKCFDRNHSVIAHACGCHKADFNVSVKLT